MRRLNDRLHGWGVVYVEKQTERKKERKMEGRGVSKQERNQYSIFNHQNWALFMIDFPSPPSLLNYDDLESHEVILLNNQKKNPPETLAK